MFMYAADMCGRIQRGENQERLETPYASEQNCPDEGGIVELY